MRHAIALSLLVVAGLAQAADQARTVPPFTAIDVTGALDVAIDVGPTQSITARGNDEFLSQLTTEVTGGELRIGMKSQSGGHVSGHYGDAKVTITVPKLTKFALSGAGGTRITNLAGESFEVHYSGAGSLVAEGHVKRLDMDVGGVGSIDTRDLIAENAKVNVGGVGSVRVYASNQLDAVIGGVGSLKYYGNPRTVNKTAGGIGSISKGD